MKRSQVFLLFYIAAPLLLIARVLQRFYMIDPGTGFYQDGLSAAGAAVTVAFIAFPVVAHLLCRLSRPAQRRFPERSVPLAVGAFIAGACLILETVDLLLRESGAASFLLAFLSAVFAAVMILRGLGALKVMRFSAWLTPVGTVYAVVRLIARFADYTAEVAVADTVFDILTMCLLLLFLHADGKLQAGLATEKIAASFLSFGLSTALLCAAVVLPDLIDLALGGRFALYGGDLPEMSYLGFAVMALCAVFSVKPAGDAHPLDNGGNV